jgi:hypothetical protein
MGDGSPDRADALIWGLAELFPRVVVANEAPIERVEVFSNGPLFRASRQPTNADHNSKRRSPWLLTHRCRRKRQLRPSSKSRRRPKNSTPSTAAAAPRSICPAPWKSPR